MSAPNSQGHAFRADIQGLRALAVGAVIAYHAHVPGVPGGFAGVDIFFVLSGFLICGLLQRELTATGTLDVAGFWLRRARRLLPNASVTLLATIIASALILPGYLLPDVASGVAAAALYGANLLFAARATDYFANAEAPNPVLHFWSLSVEEQFYIAWPLLLAGLVLVSRARAPRAAVWLLATIFTVSFAASLRAIGFDQPVAFYHAEMRAWELAVGGLVAALGPALAGWGRIKTGSAWLGLAGIIASLTLLDSGMRYPGVLALLPVVSTAALLLTSNSIPSRLLAVPPLQWLGDRSYSLYLWHWPALVFAGAALRGNPLATPIGLAAGAGLALAAYRWVEQPVRSGKVGLPLRFSPRWQGAALAATAIGLVLAGSGGLALPLGGAGGTAAIAEELRAAAKDHGRPLADHCHLRLDEVDQPPCIYGDATSLHRAVLLGDSHAAQWFAALDTEAKQTGWQLANWTKSSCPAVDAALWYPPRRANFTACAQWLAGVMARLTGGERPERVFVASRNDYDGYILDPATGTLAAHAEADRLWREGFRAILARLVKAGIEVVVIRDTPKLAKDYAQCLSANGGTGCDSRRADALAEPAADVEAARGLAGVETLDLSSRLCGPAICPLRRDGRIIYQDWQHLTASFAASLAPEFAPYLPRVGAR